VAISPSRQFIIRAKRTMTEYEKSRQTLPFRTALKRGPRPILRPLPSKPLQEPIGPRPATSSPSQVHQKRPAYPASGLDHPDVRAAWFEAHDRLRLYRAFLEPEALRRAAESSLRQARMQAETRGRKPSGDLRHPVPRDFQQMHITKSRSDYEAAVARSLQTIQDIETGQVVGVKVWDDGGGDHHIERDDNRHILNTPFRFVTLTTVRDMEREGARVQALADRTPEQIEAEEAAIEASNAAFLAELEAGPKPTGNPFYDRTAGLIKAKAAKDTATKERTAARKRAEAMDPEGTLNAKQERARKQAANRKQKERTKKTPDQLAAAREKDRQRKRLARAKASEGTPGE